MVFTTMVWVATIDLGFAFRAEAEKLIHAGAYHTKFFSPWGEPRLTEESGPLRSSLAFGNHSSIESTSQFDEKAFLAQLQRLSVQSDESATVLLRAAGDVFIEEHQLDSDLVTAHSQSMSIIENLKRISNMQDHIEYSGDVHLRHTLWLLKHRSIDCLNIGSSIGSYERD